MTIFTGVDLARFREFLPESVRCIIEYCGDDVALKLIEKYGGCDITFPYHAVEKHPLFDVLGPVNFEKLCACFGGEQMFIPKSVALSRHIRNEKIHELRAQGKRLPDIARAVGLTQRQIKNILKDRNG